jgi:hypothetical protein
MQRNAAAAPTRESVPSSPALPLSPVEDALVKCGLKVSRSGLPHEVEIFFVTLIYSSVIAIHMLLQPFKQLWVREYPVRGRPRKCRQGDPVLIKQNLSKFLYTMDSAGRTRWIEQLKKWLETGAHLDASILPLKSSSSSRSESFITVCFFFFLFLFCFVQLCLSAFCTPSNFLCLPSYL